ncbi:MAG: molybdopterin-dependent oxidoreductase [Leptolinea sp.]|jgi:NADH dehydrogenase/NADH:ubiquinone oxidoreductase subunit G|nr:molybdopterin-dependent oxidoreductase [Leptolinea sp.]
MTLLSLTINGKTVQAEKGQTILQAAQRNDIDIPTLCAYKDLPPFGGCRMCVVEVDGMRGFPTACTTPAEEGMIVRTETTALQTLRLETFNMLLSEHPLSCLVCPEKGNCTECMMTIRKGGVTTGCGSCPKDQQCELQTLAKRLGVDEIRLPVKYRMYPVEKFDPFYDRDYNLCILCGRCVQVCDKLHILSTLTFIERGSHTKVGTAFERSHVDAGCSFCGACVDRCPVGALTEKTRKWEGVAESEVESICPYCSAGCSIRLQVRKGTVIGCLPGEDPTLNAGNLCVHGRFGLSEVVNYPGRLKTPWRQVDGHKFECGWEEVIELAAAKLAAANPQNISLQISTNLPDEDLFVARKFAEQVLHLPVPDAGKAVSPSGFERLVQRAATFEQMRQADCLLVAGLETRYSASWLEYEFKQLKQNGATLISAGNGKRPLDRFANEFIYTNDEGAEEAFVDVIDRLGRENQGATTLDRAICALHNSRRAFLLIGPEYLSNPRMLEQLAILAERLQAGVICLPMQGNFYGAIHTGIMGKSASQSSQPEVLYCIGDQPEQPADLILYQNAFPTVDVLADIGLPTALFTERDGTYTNVEFRQRRFIKAVEPAGLARPDWQIIAGIARQMGASGFDYHSIGDIRKEMTSSDTERIWKPGLAAELLSISGNEPVFMGSPLSTRVAGLRTLFPSPEAEAGE